MLRDEYRRKLRAMLDEIDALPSIRQAARLLADTLLAGGSVHLYDTGHMLMTEAVGRAGGLLAMTPLRIEVRVDDPVRPAARREPQVGEEEIRGLVRYALAASNVRPGDALIIGSVSGTRPLPMELALQARAMGVRTVGITSFRYSAVATRHHSSGQRLADVVDVAIDNVGEVGDAVVDAPQVDTRICPTSGITAAYIIWLLTADLVEELNARGAVPRVFKSINLPGADAFNRAARETYERVGY